MSYLTNVTPIWSLIQLFLSDLADSIVFVAVFAEFRWWKDKKQAERKHRPGVSIFMSVCRWVCFACQTDYALSVWLQRGHSIIQQICNNLKLFVRRWFSTATLKELCSEWRRFMNIGGDCDSLTQGTKPSVLSNWWYFDRKTLREVKLMHCSQPKQTLVNPNALNRGTLIFNAGWFIAGYKNKPSAAWNDTVGTNGKWHLLGNEFGAKWIHSMVQSINLDVLHSTSLSHL